MKNIFSALLTVSIGSMIVSSIANTPSTSTPQKRSAQTCADSSLTVPFIQAFNPSAQVHAIASLPAYAGNTAGQVGWPSDGPIFLAWATPQNFTAPFYLLNDGTTGDDQIEISTDGSPPSVPGYTTNDIRGYAYTTQVCGSVPLYGAWNKAGGKDHFYTTLPNVHAQLITVPGWADAGIPFYVISLPSACSCGA